MIFNRVLSFLHLFSFYDFAFKTQFTRPVVRLTKHTEITVTKVTKMTRLEILQFLIRSHPTKVQIRAGTLMYWRKMNISTYNYLATTTPPL